ncbi:hypothetical protein DC914_RS27725 [Vibrio parahaemolyticus]|uniref:hypothetical protein n=1 Tax=Vibrio parahaemolyticus TaxID=670 RepID=UPI0006BF2093|nr:hypothetical protein [Vibrio parahaemolyticus]EGR5928037.1 hypothetical protein [Vibrio parahaemolyticus]EJG0181820.1 hypothetical protein [Vibrio parahaemolyticus]KOY37998.1 hypothetical protein ACX10_12180 [Vibrio parahaemolyticus]
MENKITDFLAFESRFAVTFGLSSEHKSNLDGYVFRLENDNIFIEPPVSQSKSNSLVLKGIKSHLIPKINEIEYLVIAFLNEESEFEEAYSVKPIGRENEVF